MAYVSKGWGRKYVGCKDGRKSGRLELFEELVDQDKDWDVEEEHSVNSWELRASQFDYGDFSYCPVCYEWFDNQLAMLMHGVCHLWLPQIRRVCKKCQWVATRKIKTAYYHHSVRKHPKRFRWCQPCQLVFIVKKDHADHLRTHDKGYTGRDIQTANQGKARLNGSKPSLISLESWKNNRSTHCPPSNSLPSEVLSRRQYYTSDTWDSDEDDEDLVREYKQCSLSTSERSQIRHSTLSEKYLGTEVAEEERVIPENWDDSDSDCDEDNYSAPSSSNLETSTNLDTRSSIAPLAFASQEPDKLRVDICDDADHACSQLSTPSLLSSSESTPHKYSLNETVAQGISNQSNIITTNDNEYESGSEEVIEKGAILSQAPATFLDNSFIHAEHDEIIPTHPDLRYSVAKQYESTKATWKPEPSLYSLRNKKSSKASPGSHPSIGRNCRICFKSPDTPTLTTCGHIFCKKCLMEEISRSLKCPACFKVFFIRLNPVF